jgi:hypothetical protein
MLALNRLRLWTGLLALLSVTIAQSVSAQTFYQVSPTGSFYRTYSDASTAPLVISLADFFGAASLDLKPQGILQVAGPYSPTHDAVFCAVFSTTSDLLGTSAQDRVSGAVASAATGTSPCVTVNTFYGGQPTDISQDFFIPFSGLSVDVPVGATHLFVAVFDDFYADNVSPQPTEYGLLVSSTVPEPGTLALSCIGIVVCIAAGHRSRSVARIFGVQNRA